MRIKNAVNARKKRKKILKAVKGYRGALSRRYRLAKQAYIKAKKHAYSGRKLKKRNFRKLWITRINIAARNEGLKYNELIYGLKVAGVSINRKMLAELAINDPESFKEYVNIAKKAINK